MPDSFGIFENKEYDIDIDKRLDRVVTEKIICPGCGNIVDGTIEFIQGAPFEIYYGHCDKCDYNITESDWEEA